MLRIVVNNSSKAAKSYYAEALTKGDYYTKGKDTEIIGLWGGEGSQLLGLKGVVGQVEFSQLCDNINPYTGEQLTARNSENRRIGYDINFHAPKSVSLVYSINRDEQILKAFRLAVNETMTELEKDMNTRVRKKGAFHNVQTSNAVYAEFIHTTSRPVNGVPDPHLHAHCFTFNATFDHNEQQWKAGEFGKIKKDASYFEAFFHSQFADKLKNLGYGIEQTKNGWEIAGIERGTVEKFSRRTSEIEDLAKQKGIIDAREKDKLGAKTRKGKDKNLSANDLVKEWLSRMTDKEKTDVLTIKERSQPDNLAELPKRYIDLAAEHILERKSVAGEREILRQALKKSVGKCNPEQIMKAYNNDGLLRANVKDEIFLTSREAINEERNLVRLATEGKGRYFPIAREYEFENKHLNKDQQKAVKHALTSKDGVIVIEGGAGTGKTTLMTELKQAINKAGKEIHPFAPSAEASRGVLRSEGFEKAETVAQLLQNKQLQQAVKNGYIWIDEAGQLGNKAMVGILELANKQNARVILTGDTKQHNSVERGDALRLILEKSKIKSVRTNEILRQRVNDIYKAAVNFISKDKHSEGFGKLDEMKAIHEIADGRQRYQAIAKDYCDSVRKGKSALVISPTHNEIEIVTAYIRDELKNGKRLGKIERLVDIQKNLSPTEAEKKDLGYYQMGMSIQFNQNVKGFKRGGIYDIVGKDEKTLTVTDGGKQFSMPLNDTKKFSVYEKRQIELAKGDIIRISQNGFSENGKRLNNGSNLTVKGFDESGNIVANTGVQDVILNKDYRNFNYGYCTTSHSSQGKTVDKVIISQSSMSGKAASKEQFYVSASRGKSDIAIYTDNKDDLKRSVIGSSQRMNAIDVFKSAEIDKIKKAREQQKLVSRLAALNRIWQQRTQSISKNSPTR